MIAAPAESGQPPAPALFLDGSIIPEGYLGQLAVVVEEACDVEALLIEYGIEDWT